MVAILVETALESQPPTPMVVDGFDMDKPNWQTLPLPLHCMRSYPSPRIEGQGASGAPWGSWANTELHTNTDKRGGLFIAPLVSFLAKLFSQSEEDGALSLLSCAVLPNAQSGDFWGPGSIPISSKGQANPFGMEKQYNNPETTRTPLEQKYWWWKALR